MGLRQAIYASFRAMRPTIEEQGDFNAARYATTLLLHHDKCLRVARQRLLHSLGRGNHRWAFYRRRQYEINNQTKISSHTTNALESYHKYFEHILLEGRTARRPDEVLQVIINFILVEQDLTMMRTFDRTPCVVLHTNEQKSRTDEVVNRDGGRDSKSLRKALEQRLSARAVPISEVAGVIEDCQKYLTELGMANRHSSVRKVGGASFVLRSQPSNRRKEPVQRSQTTTFRAQQLTATRELPETSPQRSHAQMRPAAGRIVAARSFRNRAKRPSKEAFGTTATSAPKRRHRKRNARVITGQLRQDASWESAIAAAAATAGGTFEQRQIAARVYAVQLAIIEGERPPNDAAELRQCIEAYSGQAEREMRQWELMQNGR